MMRLRISPCGSFVGSRHRVAAGGSRKVLMGPSEWLFFSGGHDDEAGNVGLPHEAPHFQTIFWWFGDSVLCWKLKLGAQSNRFAVSRAIRNSVDRLCGIGQFMSLGIGCNHFERLPQNLDLWSNEFLTLSLFSKVLNFEWQRNDITYYINKHIKMIKYKYQYIEWASALVPPTPLCGAGPGNKTRGKVKTIINEHIPSRVMEEKSNREAEA